jgi:hypothetical protein
MKNPAVKAPVCILAALSVTYVLGFGLNIALSVCMGAAWPDLLASPTGLPVAQLLYNVLGKKGGVAFMALAAAICNFTGASCLQAQARTAFALSRGCSIARALMVDEMLPFSRYLHRVWSRTQTPVIAVWVNVLFCACLGLIDLASFTAITAIFNVSLLSRVLNSGNCDLCRLGLLYSHLLQGICIPRYLIVDSLARAIHTRANLFWKSVMVYKYFGLCLDGFRECNFPISYRTTCHSP